MMLYITVFTIITLINGDVIIPKGIAECYMEPGDINIALLTEIRKRGKNNTCEDSLKDLYRPQIVEGFIYALQKINKNRKLVPRFRLGYVVLDTCMDDIEALGQVMRVIPSSPGEQAAACSATEGPLPHTQAAAVVGFTNSRQTVMVSGVLSLFQIPIIGATASSDDLSDKERFSYFSRIVPPDRYQTQAMLDFIVYHNWTYISMVYSSGNYGENGARYLERGAKSRGICYAFVHMIDVGDTVSDYDLLVHNLLNNENAKVVVLFVFSEHAEEVFKAVARQGIVGKFIWIGGDDLGDKDFGPSSKGLFTVTYTLGSVDGFPEYYQEMKSFEYTNRPWMKMLWEETHNCTFEENNTDKSLCNDTAKPTAHKDAITGLVSKATDSVYTLALGLHSLLQDARPLDYKFNWVKGSAYRAHILNVTFDGDSGPIQFDRNGDCVGQYIFSRHLRKNKTVDFEHVAKWDQASGKIMMFEPGIDWAEYNDKENVTKPPLSRCSQPCEGRTYTVLLDVHCCWECQACRINERVRLNKTGCEQCPAQSWPDESGTRCLPIPPSYLQPADASGLAILVTAAVALFFAALTSGCYFFHRHNRLIKASSLGLSVFILTGIWVAFIGVYFFIARPTDVLCMLNRIAFHIGASLIYAPLLVKTNRVYRIFAAGRKGVKRISLISSRSQMVFVTVALSLQVILFVVSVTRNPPDAITRMPVPTQRYVELMCHLTVEGLVMPLSYNLALLILCAIYGFLTRKLPENFNESWYIFISVSTTVLLWAVFLPTYFTLFYAFYQSALLAFCLLLNGIVTLLCLYVPKLYAIYFMDEDSLEIKTAASIKKQVQINQIIPND